MISYDEYFILKKITEYKKQKNNNHDWVILSDDFIEFTRKEKYYVHATFQELHQNGLIMDTSEMVSTTTHSVCITDIGKKEFNVYKRKRIKKFLLWFIPIFISAVGVVAAIIGIFL